MTYKEYYSMLPDDAFIAFIDWRDAYNLPEPVVGRLAKSFNAKVLAIGGDMTYNPPYYTEAGDIIPPPAYFSAQNKAFLSEYDLSRMYAVFMEGFKEAETESTTSSGSETRSDSSDTFKSFPQVTSAELAQDNKIGKSTTSGSVTDSSSGSRSVTRSYNTRDNVEYIVSMFTNILNTMAKDYVKLTALDGIYFTPEL